ncbi:MAG TPA: MFS transporter [Victivallales bacterium]|nr:MFS transporter [Victivallales bacterium]
MNNIITEKTVGGAPKEKAKSPWAWVPSTYIMEGLPDSMIMIVLAIMLKNFGYSNILITFYTGALVFPWVIKPLWAPFIDIFRTKRWWLYVMEISIAGGFVAMAISLKFTNFFIICISLSWVIAFMASSHDIACDGFYIKHLAPSKQAFFVGIQGAGYNIGKIIATGGIVILAGILFDHLGSYHSAWFFSMLAVAIICCCFGFYHKFILPKETKREKKSTIKDMAKEFLIVYLDFIRMKDLWLAILFLFFYRVGESIVTIILPLFFLSPISKGGLGLSDQFTGVAYGTLAPIAIVLGSILGGYVIYRKGFKYWIWTMLLLENIPHLLYYMLAYYHIYNHVIIASCIFVEQLSFSFGLCAFTMFLFYMVRNSKYKTAHYAFFSGIKQIAVMVPVMISGWLQHVLGYQNLFLFILILIIPAGIVVFFVRNKLGDYGKKASTTA